MRLTESEYRTLADVATHVADLPSDALGLLIASVRRSDLATGDALFRAGQPNESEYFLLSGTLRTYVVDDEGNESTLAFHLGPTIYTPSIARSLGGVSQVDCEAVEPVVVAGFSNRVLIEQMVASPAVQRWGDQVLRRELARRVGRELALAAKSGRQRLAAMRDEFPDLEARVPHHMIASYLGMSPVTLSRLRQQE